MREAERHKAQFLTDMLGTRKKAAPVGKNGAGTSESKAIDPLRNLGECLSSTAPAIRMYSVINGLPLRVKLVTPIPLSPPPPSDRCNEEILKIRRMILGSRRSAAI